MGRVPLGGAHGQYPFHPPPPANLPVEAYYHPAGQAYWNKLGTGLLGENALGYRAASVLLGTVAVLATYLLGAVVWDRRVGLLAAFLIAVNQYHLGISHACFQKNYLTFALLAAWVFLRVQQSPSTRSWIVLGILGGLGCFTGVTVLLWGPVLLGTLIARRTGREQLRTAGPWMAAALCLLVLSPYLLRDVQLSREGADGLSFQLSKFRPLVWSWAPASLFVRPLYFNLVEGTISEYVAMHTAPGLTLLMGGLLGVFLRGWTARFVLALGWWPFVFFSLFSRPDGELFWADFAIPPFALLTAAIVLRSGRWASWLATGLAGLHAVFAWPVISARDRYFPLEWGQPPKALIEKHLHALDAIPAAFKDRDLAQLTTVGRWRLPMRQAYIEGLTRYGNALQSPATDRQLVLQGWMEPGDERGREIRWTQRQLRRLQAPGVSPPGSARPRSGSPPGPGTAGTGSGRSPRSPGSP